MTVRNLTLFDAERLASRPALDEDVSLGMTEEAFRSFYDRTAPGLWSYLTRATGDRDRAGDLLQETYYRLLKARVEFQGEAHRRHYLFRIAANLLRDAHRRRMPALVSLSAEDREAPIASDGAPTRFETRADVTRALNGLRPRDRDLLWLAYAQGYSHDEIAETLGLRPGSIKLMLSRARQRMAAALGAVRATAQRRGTR
jgi:RNA polymerase sigma-70 factor (ECF subfamily)